VINLTLALRGEIIKNWSNTTMMMIITFQLSSEFVQNFCRQRARARSKISYMFARQTTKNSQTRMGKWLTKNVWFNLFTFESLYLKARY
jgi:CDP-glycerol glycerophosphotransferase (TagB/SpsB family)